MSWLAPRNLGWKLGSLLLATLLWIAMSAEPEVISTHTTPVLYQNLPAEYLVVGDSPETVHLEVRGPATQLTSGNLADTVVMFDMSKVAASGDRTLTISDANLNLPRSVTFLRAVPSQIRLRLARLVTKSVPVDIRFVGTLPAGYRLVGSSAFPATLQIAGGENRVHAVTKVETDPIDLSSVMQSTSVDVNTFVPEPQVRLVDSPMVTVKLDVASTKVN